VKGAAVVPRYVAIVNPDGKRWQAYARDLAAFWAAHGVTAEVEVVPWRVVVPRLGNLDGLPAFDRPALVRMDSPGRDFEVKRLLLQAGATPDSAADWTTIADRKGHLASPRTLYAGFARVLAGLRSSFNARPHLRPLSCPLAVAELFDKNATSARLEAAGIPCPPSLSPPSAAEQLLTELRSRRWPSAYVKIASSSSASGIAVVHALDEPPWAITSVVRLPDGWYSSRRLYRPVGQELDELLTFLLGEGACVQRGIPMAQMDGQNFDVRVVVIHGRPEFTVFRLSSQPMTNLHLGGRRGDPVRCRANIPTRSWLDALDHCVEAAQLYPCAAVGVDLLFERGYLRHYLLEINAFGDFFPGLTDARGRSVHSVEIETSARRFGLLD
jgi:hypothetical protein